MKSTNRTPEDILDHLMPFLSELYRIMEVTVPETQAEFEEKNEGIDPYFGPHKVRYKTRICLQKLEPSAGVCDITEMPNNGLEVAYARDDHRYSVRIWKAVNGLLPAPGLSLAKRRFWQQGSLFDEKDCIVLNLAVIWIVDSKFNLIGLDLVRPKGGIPTWDIGQQDWSISIPHPATLARINEDSQASDRDLDSFKELDDDDLDISEDETGTN